MYTFIFRDAFVSVEIFLLDVNDNGPTFLPNNQYTFKTKTDIIIGATIGKVEVHKKKKNYIYFDFNHCL